MNGAAPARAACSLHFHANALRKCVIRAPSKGEKARIVFGLHATGRQVHHAHQGQLTRLRRVCHLHRAIAIADRLRRQVVHEHGAIRQNQPQIGLRMRHLLAQRNVWSIMKWLVMALHVTTLPS